MREDIHRQGDREPDDLTVDLELARAAAGGDEEAWRLIYETTCQRLFNFLCYQTGDRDAALDLLQETYVVALRKIDGYRGDGSLQSWLRAVALRRCLDWRRRVSLRLSRLKTLAGDRALLAGSEAHQEYQGLGRGFQKVLADLSPHQRAAILLRELEDQSFAEIAAALGCGEATARVHYHRACRNLKQSLTRGTDPVFGGNAGGMTS